VALWALWASWGLCLANWFQPRQPPPPPPPRPRLPPLSPCATKVRAGAAEAARGAAAPQQGACRQAPPAGGEGAGWDEGWGLPEGPGPPISPFIYSRSRRASWGVRSSAPAFFPLRLLLPTAAPPLRHPRPNAPPPYNRWRSRSGRRRTRSWRCSRCWRRAPGSSCAKRCGAGAFLGGGGGKVRGWGLRGDGAPAVEGRAAARAVLLRGPSCCGGRPLLASQSLPRPPHSRRPWRPAPQSPRPM
jgi:hypothetical protein